MSSYKVVAFPAEILPKEYLPLIFSKWLRSLRFGNDYFLLIEPRAYYTAYHRYIDNILHRGETTVRIASLTDDSDVVLGFSVSRGQALDYVHVHKDHRRMGIGTKLVPEGITSITHLTKTGLTIWGSRDMKWTFNPFI